MLTRPHGAPKRQLARLQIADVVPPVSLVLVMHSTDVPEAGDARGEQVRPAPEVVSIAKADLGRIFDERVSTADVVTSRHQLVIRVARPGPLGGPVGDRRFNLVPEN